MRNVRKFLLILMVVMLLAGCNNLTQAEPEPDIDQGNLRFTLINDRTAYAVSRGNREARHIEIPEEYNGFMMYRYMTSITIPNSVTSIGKWVFFECTGLRSITTQ